MSRKKIVKSTHLDFGCGNNPRNPFGSYDTISVDINRYSNEIPHYVIKPGSPLPFQDNTIDSISAFDVLEHLSREPSNNLFVFYMNELHRILKPKGMALFIFPDVHNREVYSDPTHVNFIHKNTVDYFLSNSPNQNYAGIQTNYILIKNKKIRIWNSYFGSFSEINEAKNLRRKLSLIKREFYRLIFPTHRVWILKKNV